MGFFRIFRKSRYSLNPSQFHYAYTSPLSNPTSFVISSSGYPLFHRNFITIASNSCFLPNISDVSGSIFHSGVISCFTDRCRSIGFKSTCNIRLYSILVDVDANTKETPGKKGANLGRNGVSQSVIKDIIDVVKEDGSDMETRLNLIGSNLSKLSIIESFRTLNESRVPGLRFFQWVKDVYPGYNRNSDICSLAVDNCGRLEDYSTMLSLLKEFKARRICMSSMAFGFLNISNVAMETAKGSIEGVVGLLDEVRGSCYNSGIHSLIALLCSLDLVDLAKYVIKITERKAAYYSVLIKHLCVKGQIEVARDVFDEMRQVGCVPDSNAYNYLISNLCMQGRLDEACSVPDEMTDRGCPPDHVTFEILIYFTCRCGRSDDAAMLHNVMVKEGIIPRLMTHTAFIRGYVSAQRFDEAYKHVVRTAEMGIWSAQEVYNVLASLHIKHGDLLFAHKLLIEMIEKGLKPKHSVFRRVVNRLHKTGRSEIAKNLGARYSTLAQEVRGNPG